MYIEWDTQPYASIIGPSSDYILLENSGYLKNKHLSLGGRLVYLRDQNDDGHGRTVVLNLWKLTH